MYICSLKNNGPRTLKTKMIPPKRQWPRQCFGVRGFSGALQVICSKLLIAQPRSLVLNKGSVWHLQRAYCSSFKHCSSVPPQHGISWDIYLTPHSLMALSNLPFVFLVTEMASMLTPKSVQQGWNVNQQLRCAKLFPTIDLSYPRNYQTFCIRDREWTYNALYQLRESAFSG